MKKTEKTTKAGGYAPTQEEISHLAHLLWKKRGCQDGHDDENWLDAENALVRYHRSHPPIEEAEELERRTEELLSEFGTQPGERSPTSLSLSRS